MKKPSKQHRIPRRAGWAGLVLLAGLVQAESTSVRSAPADSAARLDLSSHVVVLMFDDAWHSVFRNAYPLLREHGMTAVVPVISDYLGKGGPRYSGSASAYMNRAELQEMIDVLGIEIASHTKSHPFLTRLSNEAVREELVGSKNALEAAFKQDVMTFVYPYGDYDSRIRGLVEEAGYAVARSIRPGTVNFAERPYDLPSTEIRKSNSVQFARNQVIKHPVLILFLHKIVPEPASYTEWSTDQLATFLDWLDENQVEVITLRELYRREGGMPPRVATASRRTWRQRVEWDLLQDVDVNFTRATERR